MAHTIITPAIHGPKIDPFSTPERRGMSQEYTGIPVLLTNLLTLLAEVLPFAKTAAFSSHVAALPHQLHKNM